MAAPESGKADNDAPQIAPVGETFKVRPFAATSRRQTRQVTGRRTHANNTTTGYVIRAIIPQQPITRFSDVALIPSLLQAAQHAVPKQPIIICAQDLRRKVRAARIPNLILFVVDASGSMAARQRMTAVKGAILSLLLDAYQKRDSVGLITFCGTEASLLLPPTNSVSLAQKHLATLPTGGRTPLADGLRQAYQLLHRETRGDKALTPLLVLLSDGRANVGHGNPLAETMEMAQKIAHRRWSSLVVDCESGYPRLGLAAKVAQALNGNLVQLETLAAETLDHAVRQQLQRGTS